MKDLVKQVEWESNFFGFDIYEFISNNPDPRDIVLTLEKIRLQNAALVYLFLKEPDKKYYQFKDYLITTKVKFRKDLLNNKENNPFIRSYSSTEAYKNLIPLALTSGIHSRFKLDSNFGVDNFKRMYTEWIRKSVSREMADEVLVFYDSDIKGLITLSIKNDDLDIGLLAVDASQHGRGIGKKLIESAESFAMLNGCKTISVWTQKENINACNFYSKEGFKIVEETLTYHFWVNNKKYESTLQ